MSTDTENKAKQLQELRMIALEQAIALANKDEPGQITTARAEAFHQYVLHGVDRGPVAAIKESFGEVATEVMYNETVADARAFVEQQKVDGVSWKLYRPLN